MGLLVQDSVAELLRRLHDGDEAARKEATDALVAKGSAARDALRKAHEKAGSDKRARYEEAILRIEAGSDLTYASFGECSVSIVEAGMREDATPDGKPAQRVKIVFQLDNAGKGPVAVTLARATVHTVKGTFGLLVRGAKGEAFSRQADPNVPKPFEYGAVIPPRFAAGTNAVIAVELEAGGKRQVVRTPIFAIEKKE